MDKRRIFINSCRICLKDNAKIPIFEEETDQLKLLTKILMSFQEKLDDIEEYPRNICKLCNNNVEVIYEIINKFKESQKTLSNYFLSLVKNEVDNTVDQSDCDGFSEPEISLDNIKIEFEPEFKETTSCNEFSNENVIVIEKPKKVKSPSKKRIINKKGINIKTNNVASSILEGVYAWTGERWCHSSTLKDQPAREKIVGRRPKLKIKLKKEKRPRPDKLCDTCGEVFRDADKLRMHRIKMHMPKGKFPCPVDNCKRICTSNYYLNRHVLRKHSENKNFICTDCGKSFAFKCELNHHSRVHNKDKVQRKVYKCKYCDKSYKCQKSVDIHERSAHTGLRPAVCTVCEAAFFHEEYLKQHMFLHTGETPFHCPVCNRGYAQRGNMKSHMRNHRISDLDVATLQKIKPSYLNLLKA